MGFFDNNLSGGRLPSTNTDPYGADFSSSSSYRVPDTDKATKLDANTATPNTVAKLQSSRINSSILLAETTSTSAPTPADYYRRGRLKPITDQANSPNTQVLNTQYDYNPRFLQDQEHEEVASLRLLGKAKDNSKGADIDLIPPYSKFFLEGYQEGHMERSQVVETFGEFYAFFFGERPPVYTFSGTLLNTKDINWKEDFMFYYDNFLRGTKAVEYQARVVLTYNLSQVEGYIMGVNTQAQASNDKGVGVSFQMLVTKRRSMKLSVDFGIIEDNGNFNQDPLITDMLTRGISDPGVSAAYEHTIKVNSGLYPPSKPAALSTSEIAQTNKALATERAYQDSQKQLAAIQGKVTLV